MIRREIDGFDVHLFLFVPEQNAVEPGATWDEAGLRTVFENLVETLLARLSSGTVRWDVDVARRRVEDDCFEVAVQFLVSREDLRANPEAPATAEQLRRWLLEHLSRQQLGPVREQDLDVTVT